MVGKNNGDDAWLHFKFEWANFRKFYKLTDREIINLEFQQCCNAKLC